MKKTFVMVFTAAMLLAAPAFAKIECAVDNANNTVIYRSYKNAVHWGYTATVDFMKTVAKDDSSTYRLQIKYNGVNYHQKALGDKAEVIIDGVPYQVEKIVGGFKYTNSPDEHVTMADYLVPDELAEKMGKFENNLQFKFQMKGKEDVPEEVPMKELEEIRLITQLKYTDYDAVVSGKLEPIDPSKPRPEPTFRQKLIKKYGEDPTATK